MKTRQLGDADPFGAIRSELVGAARRRVTRRRRRSRGLVVVATAVALLALSVGAAAIGGFSTGVAPVDRLLDSVPRGPEPPSGASTRGLPPGVAPPELPDVRPGPGGASDPLEVRLAGEPAASVAYVSREGLICNATAATGRPSGSPRGGGGGCVRPALLAGLVEREIVSATGLATGVDGVLHYGFAHRDVVAVRAIGPDGPVEAQITDPWSPALPGAEPLRYFVVDVPFRDGVTLEGVRPEDIPSLTTVPTFEAEYADGRVVEIEPEGPGRGAQP